ncbi:MAG: DUF4126 domain-containing protein [Acidobacteriota bacterium]
MEAVLSICLGIGLAAACGFRIFVPFLVMSVASRTEHLTLGGSFDWISTDAAMVTFAVASALEIGAYFVPWLDNLLDSMSTPVAVVAGTLAAAAAIQDTSPLVTWTLAAIGGGGAAGIIQTGMSLIRGASSLLTGGLGNPVISAAEAGTSISLAGIAVTVPLLGVALAATVMLYLAVRTGRRLAGEREAVPVADRSS